MYQYSWPACETAGQRRALEPCIQQELGPTVDASGTLFPSWNLASLLSNAEPGFPTTDLKFSAERPDLHPRLSFKHYFWLALIAKRAFGVTTAINVKVVFSAVPGPLWRRYFPRTMKTRGGDDGDTGVLPFVILNPLPIDICTSALTAAAGPEATAFDSVE
ncbi:hypothetical protein B0H14DRAFT_2610849 [Mycena olivaceomarginata]|nr:hypothetical protein B0H14DRAFT_2610849 [Mycena olivaceomarginata]